MNPLNIKQEEPKVSLSFLLESSSSLWNKIFEGFDQEYVLVSRFEGKSKETIRLLYRFGSLIHQKFKNCSVEPKIYGIVIKKNIENNDQQKTDKWIKLMEELKKEICDILLKSA